MNNPNTKRVFSRKALIKEFSGLFVGAALIGVPLVCLGLAQSDRMTLLESKIEDLQSENGKLQSEIYKLEESKMDKPKLETRVQTVDNLLKGMGKYFEEHPSGSFVEGR